MQESMLATITTKDGTEIDSIELSPRTFDSGTRGYYGMIMLVLDGKLYQAQCHLLEKREATEADVQLLAR